MAKEKKNEMRERSKESKVRNKRNTDGDGYSCDDILRPRAYAHRRARQKREVAAKSKILRWLEALEAEGVTDPVPQYVSIAVDLCHGTEKDRLLWMKMANRNINSFIGVVEDFAIDMEKHSMSRLKNPPAAFQKRLNRVLPKPKSKSKPKSKDWGSEIGGGR